MPAVEITPRCERIVDVEASPLLHLVELVPIAPESLAAVQLVPAGEGRVRLTLASAAWMGAFEMDGDCSRPLAIPRAFLAQLRRRHPDAARLIVDEQPVGGCIALRTFSSDLTVSIAGAEADALPDLPELDDLRHSESRSGSLWFQPVNLRRALQTIERLGCSLVDVETIHAESPLGVVLRLQAVDATGLSGWLALARCVLTERAVPAAGRRAQAVSQAAAAAPLRAG